MRFDGRVSAFRARSRTRWTWALAVMACAGCAVVFASDAQEGTVALPFSIELTVRADGSPVAGAIEGVGESIQQLVLEHVQRQVFVAAVEDGAPVDRDAYAVGKVLLVPSGEDYEVRFEDMAVRAVRAGETPAPRYPSDEFQRRRSGHVELLLEIDADGHVVDATVVSSRSRSFEKAARDAVARWTFETRGRPSQLSAPFWFFREGSDLKSPPVFACAIGVSEPRIEGQEGCMPTTEVILVPMRTVDGAARR